CLRFLDAVASDASTTGDAGHQLAARAPAGACAAAVERLFDLREASTWLFLIRGAWRRAAGPPDPGRARHRWIARRSRHRTSSPRPTSTTSTTSSSGESGRVRPELLATRAS